MSANSIDQEIKELAEVEIYTTPFCPFCHRAKGLLNKKGVQFNEINVMITPGMRKQMSERASGSSKVPQIFIDGKHVGGCDDLFELDFDGELDLLLGI